MAKKYLIIQTAFIGDVILATPIVESLKKEQSDILIDVLVKKENSSVLYGNRNINEVFTLDKSKKLIQFFPLSEHLEKKDTTVSSIFTDLPLLDSFAHSVREKNLEALARILFQCFIRKNSSML